MEFLENLTNEVFFDPTFFPRSFMNITLLKYIDEIFGPPRILISLFLRISIKKPLIQARWKVRGQSLPMRCRLKLSEHLTYQKMLTTLYIVSWMEFFLKGVVSVAGEAIEISNRL